MGPVNRRDTGDLTGPNPLHPIRPAAVGKPGLVPGGPEGTSSGQTIIVDWALGNICNQACWYCPPGLRNGSHGWQSARQVASALREIANHYRHGFEMDVWVSFTGGEPTLHPQFGQ